jgi:hypothetical protein
MRQAWRREEEREEAEAEVEDESGGGSAIFVVRCGPLPSVRLPLHSEKRRAENAWSASGVALQTEKPLNFA